MRYMIPVEIPIVVFHLTTALALAHLLWYGLRYAWWKTHAGRSFFIMSVSVTLTLLITVVNFYAPSYTGEYIIDTVVWFSIGCAAVYLTYASIHPPERHRGIKRKVEGAPDNDDVQGV